MPKQLRVSLAALPALLDMMKGWNFEDIQEVLSFCGMSLTPRAKRVFCEKFGVFTPSTAPTPIASPSILTGLKSRVPTPT